MNSSSYTFTPHHRIHKYFFKHKSIYFWMIFEMSPTVGSSPHFALDLSNMINPDKLKLFLSIIYNPKYNIYNLSMGQWFDVQSYTSIWQFPEMNALAKQEIETLCIKEMNNPVATETFWAYEIWQHKWYQWLLEHIYKDNDK